MDRKILLQNLAESLAERTGVTKRKAETFVRSFFEITEEALITDGNVKVKGFGTTKIVNVSDRESVNINTGERFQIEGHAKISFTADANFRDLVNHPFAHFSTIILDDDIDEDMLNAITGEIPENEQEEAAEETESAEDSMTEEGVEDVAEEPAAEAEEPVMAEEPTEEAIPAIVETPIGGDESIAEEAPIADEPAPEPLNLRKEELTNAPSASEEAESEGEDNALVTNEGSTPRPNRWKAAFLWLCAFMLMVGSYLAGHFRALDGLFTTPAEPTATATTDNKQTAKEEPSTPIALNDAEAQKAADDDIQREVEIAQAAILEGEKQAALEAARKAEEAEQAAKEAEAKKAAAKEAAEKKAAARAEELKEATKYRQMDGNWAITGVLRTRTVRPGENLYYIAQQVYGSKSFARYISFHNNIEDPNLVTVGQRIQLPRLTRKKHD